MHKNKKNQAFKRQTERENDYCNRQNDNEKKERKFCFLKEKKRERKCV